MTVVVVGFLASALALWGVPGLAEAWSQITIVAASSSLVLLIALWDRQLWIGILINILLITATLLRPHAPPPQSLIARSRSSCGYSLGAGMAIILRGIRPSINPGTVLRSGHHTPRSMSSSPPGLRTPRRWGCIRLVLRSRLGND